MVNERTMNNARPPQSPIGQNAMMGPNANVTVNNSINNNTNNVSMSMAVQQQQQQQMTTNSMMSSSDMGGYFDLPTTGKHPSSNSTHYIDWFRLKKNDIYHSLSLSLLCELNISSRYCQWIAQKCESVSIGMCSHVFCHHCIVFGVQTIYIYIYQFIHSTCPDITTTYRPNPTYFDTLSLCLSLFNILRRFLI